MKKIFFGLITAELVIVAILGWLVGKYVSGAENVLINIRDGILLIGILSMILFISGFYLGYQCWYEKKYKKSKV